MKYYLVNGKGVDAIQSAEKDDPQIKDDEVRVQVKACSLNYRDLLVAKGQYGSGVFASFIPLSDMAGQVIEVGKSVKEFVLGDRVLNLPFRRWPAGTLSSRWARTMIGGAGNDGVLAEKVAYPAESLVKIPSHMDFAEAATLPVAGLTAWSALVSFAKTCPGEWVLVQGTGGVSIFAMQLAHAMGAKVIVTTSSEKKAAEVKSLGASSTVNYKDSDWHQQVKKLTGGVDVVVDVSGGETLSKSLQICTYGARVAAIGILDGAISQIRIADLLTHQIILKGIMTGSAQDLSRLIKGVESIDLKPIIDRTFAFTEAKAALHYLESQKHLGKVVILL